MVYLARFELASPCIATSCSTVELRIGEVYMTDLILVPPVGIEPTTPWLKARCSAAELRRQLIIVISL